MLSSIRCLCVIIQVRLSATVEVFPDDGAVYVISCGNGCEYPNGIGDKIEPVSAACRRQYGKKDGACHDSFPADDGMETKVFYPDYAAKAEIHAEMYKLVDIGDFI